MVLRPCGVRSDSTVLEVACPKYSDHWTGSHASSMGAEGARRERGREGGGEGTGGEGKGEEGEGEREGGQGKERNLRPQIHGRKPQQVARASDTFAITRETASEVEWKVE